MERKRLKTKPLSESARTKVNEVNAKKKAGELAPNYKYRELTTPPEEGFDIDLIPDYQPPASGPEPRIADEHVYHTILDKVREGNYLTVAARYAGVDSNTIMTYLKKGKEGVNKLYYAFYEDMCKAEAEAEVNRINQLNEHAKEDWRAGLELLARRYPERWAKKDFTQIQVGGHITQEHKNELAQQIAEDPESRDLMRQLIQRKGVVIEHDPSASD